MFLDTGILLRAVHPVDSGFAEIRAAVRVLLTRRAQLFTGLLHFAEFWNASTRPAQRRGGFGLSIDVAKAKLDRVRRGTTMWVETPQTAVIWRRRIFDHAVKGVQVHDARTIALMLSHGKRELLTLNKRDFLRYVADGIVALTPSELIASSSTP